MKILDTIQKDDKLNVVIVTDDKHPVNNGHHLYQVLLGSPSENALIEVEPEVVDINFQNGARFEPGSVRGVLDVDLLEIVRHRLQSFQEGEYACVENDMALGFVEKALEWLEFRRVERTKRGVMGTNSK